MFVLVQSFAQVSSGKVIFSISFSVGMEEAHVIVNGDTSFGGSLLDGFLYDLECEFGLPIFAFLWIVNQDIPSGALVAVVWVNDFSCGAMLCHLLEVVASATAFKIVVKIVALHVDGNGIV